MTAYVASNQIPLNSLPTESGRLQQFIASGTNSGPSTFAPDALTAAPIFGLGGTVLQGGEIISGGLVTLVSFVGALLNGGNACWILLECTNGAQQVAPALASQHAPQFSQLTGVVGNIRNAKMSVPTASASATFSADEIIVETALGGLQYKLSVFSKAINLATSGAGGMDSGSAPANGFIALYAIYNPSTGTSNILATNATSAAVGNVYGGAGMPAGYTASALLGIWPSNASGQFVIGQINDRRFSGVPVAPLVASPTSQGTPVGLSISNAAPQNAKRVIGYTEFTTSIPSNLAMSVAATATGIGIAKTFGVTTSQFQLIDFPFTLDLVTPQTIYYTAFTSGGTPSYSIIITSYEI